MKKSISILLILISILSVVVYAEEINDISFELQNPLDRNIEIPSSLKSISAFLFNLKDTTFAVFIILVALLVMIFFLVQAACELLPFIGKTWKAWLMSISITLIISISGGLIKAAEVLYSIPGVFETIKNNSIMNFIFSVLLMIIIFIATLMFIQHLGKEKEITEIESSGRKVAKMRIKAEIENKYSDF